MDIKTLADITRVYGESRADQPAITFDSTTWSYADFDRRTNKVGQALAAAGVGVGDRVAILDKNSPEYFDVAFGATKVGAVMVPVNFRLSSREVAAILTDAKPRVLVVGESLHSVVEEIEDELGELLILSTSQHDRWGNFADWVSPHDDTDPGHVPAASDVALQLYTSGTTGLPKGVMLTHTNLLHFGGTSEDIWHIGPDSVVLGAMPLFHIAGTVLALLALFHGAHLIEHRELVPTEVIDALEKWGVTQTLFVPAVLQILLQAPNIGSADFSKLDMIVYGASPISDDVLKRSIDAFGCGFVQAYGLTESTAGIAYLPPEDHHGELMRSCGKPIPGSEIRVVRVGTEEDADEGEVGEVWIRSPQNMAGYWGKPEETAAVLTADGWLRSGDAGYMRDGYLYLHDRIKDMIVSGAENVYPAEVENVLMGHPDIADVAVIGVPDDKWGESVKAVVVVREGATLSAEEIIEHARGQLAHYKCPKSVDFVEALPRNPSGKILKRELREPYWAGRDRRIS